MFFNLTASDTLSGIDEKRASFNSRLDHKYQARKYAARQTFQVLKTWKV
jgi:hypothetical protein